MHHLKILGTSDSKLSYNIPSYCLGRIDQLEKRQTQDDAVINVINR